MVKIKKILGVLICFLKFAYIYLFFFFLPKSKRKVIFIAQNTDIGGTQTFFYNFLNYLKSREYKIHVLVNESENNYLLESFCSEHSIGLEFYGDELKYLEYWYPWKHSLAKYFLSDFLKQVIGILRKCIKLRASKIIVSSAYPSSFFSALCIPSKVFYFVHSMPWGKLDPGKKGILDFVLKRLKNKNIITVSNYAKKRILKFWNLKEDNVDVIYNFSDINKIGLKQKQNNGIIVVLTLGNVIDTKNPELWIQVARQVLEKPSNIKIEFTWAGEGELLEKMQSETKEFDNINFIDKHNNVAELYCNADIYFQPSKWESHGLAVVEAMSFALPCIATNNGGTAESLIHGESGFLVDVEDSKELVETLTRLIKNEGLRKEVGSSAKERHKSLFSKEIWYNNMDNFFKHGKAI